MLIVLNTNINIYPCVCLRQSVCSKYVQITVEPEVSLGLPEAELQNIVKTEHYLRKN